MKLSELLTYFTDTIFRRDVNEWRNPVVRWLVQQYRLLFYTARGLLEHGTIVRSAALTFYTLMSLVPILAVVFAVVKGFGLADGLVENLYSLFPRNPDIVDYIVDFVDNALRRTQGGVMAVVALIALIVLVVFTQKHKRLEGSLMQETNAVSLMFAATNKPQIDVSLHKIDKRHDVIERRHVAKRHANYVSPISQRLLPPTGCPFTISLESEQESFSRDNLRVTKPPRTHIFSTSSDSFKYFRHAPGLQLQPVRMWMFFAADANWICQSLSSLTPTS